MHLPFSQGHVVLEIGGGDRPSFHPNLDIRKVPGVDIVADLNERFPIEDCSFDGVYSSYMIEHVSWRKIRHLISEIFRVLKPGGKVFLVTANLLEQAKRLASTKEWTDSDVCMIFGDQNYSGDDWRANSHTCGFSPEFATKMFVDAGFEDVAVVAHPNCRTDMVIEARRPMMKTVALAHTHEHAADTWTTEQRKDAYDKHYFHGGHKVGGYAGPGYWDFAAHWCTFNHIMSMKPTSVLELGAARGYVLKRIEDLGIRVKGLEISDHCYQTRVIKDIVTWDITQTPWPIKDKEFDLCVSVATLEHIPEAALPRVIAEIERTTTRGLHGIDLGDHDDGFDKTHCTLRFLEWWKERLPASQIAVDKESLEVGVGPPGPDGKLKLNIGSFTTMFHYGWLNLDIAPLSTFASQNGFAFGQIDASKEWAFKNDSADLIFSSHFLEHLSYSDGVEFLKRCYRTMKPGALIRLLVPDASELVRSYNNGDMLSRFGQLGSYDNLTDAQILHGLLVNGHNAIYDEVTLVTALRSAGFTNVKRMAFRKSQSQQMSTETIDMFPDLSLIVEAVK